MKKGSIYKIVNDVNNEVYVGSTEMKLSQRFSCHKRHCIFEKFKNYPLYKLMNDIGFNHFQIELLEEVEFETKMELRKIEGQYILNFGTLNKMVAGRSNKEYYEINKETLLNKIKLYRQSHIEEIRKTKKEYYENNREKDLQRKTEKILCCCGKSISRCNMARHKQLCKNRSI